MFTGDRIYISTTLPYINSNPHVGHAYEFILADFLKRFFDRQMVLKECLRDSSFGVLYRPYKHFVFLNTGIDEHGQKVHQKALELNLDPQEYCDQMCDDWVKFCNTIQMQYSKFYRTTSKEHKKLAQEYIFEIRNQLYKAKYSGKYCDGCESFKTEKEITNNQCEFHPSLELKDIEEENFFFPLTNFKDINLNSILVDNNLQSELKSIVEGCGDLSVSREGVKWGINIPFTNQKMYVWFEALLNYVFAIGYKPSLLQFDDFSAYWKNSLIICGKDNLKFQAYILPALLSANKIQPPKKILVHGMIMDENGYKMSKSTGNVVDPIDQINKFGIDAFRYYLLSGINTFKNSKYSESDLINKYNNDLCNNFGNLFSRITGLIEGINQTSPTESPTESYQLFDTKPRSNFHLESIEKIGSIIEEIKNTLNVKEGLNNLNDLVTDINKYFTDCRPWDKNRHDRFGVLVELYDLVKIISLIYECVVPNLDGKVKFISMENPNFIPSKLAFSETPNSTFRKIKKEILFKKIEKETA